MPDPVPDTDNHNLPKVPPLDSQYSDEWGFILNDGEFADGSDAGSDALVEALEERTPIVDSAANRGEYFPYSDALFIASDTGQVSLGDGASWSSRGVVPNDSDVLDAINGADIAPNLVDANAVNTDSLDVDGVIGTSKERFVKRRSDFSTVFVETQSTFVPADETTRILGSGGDTRIGGPIWVVGRIDSGTRFTDPLLATVATFNVGTPVTDDNPPDRNYSITAGGTLFLNISTATNVSVISLAANVGSP